MIKWWARTDRHGRCPTTRLSFAQLTSADELPQGWGVDVGSGHYRLRKRDDDALFGHSARPQSWKAVPAPSPAEAVVVGRGRAKADTAVESVSGHGPAETLTE